MKELRLLLLGCAIAFAGIFLGRLWSPDYKFIVETYMGNIIATVTFGLVAGTIYLIENWKDKILIYNKTKGGK